MEEIIPVSKFFIVVSFQFLPNNEIPNTYMRKQKIFLFLNVLFSSVVYLNCSINAKYNTF